MKVIFMGTPEFSVPTLNALIQSKHEVVACYTQPDKPKGRGKKMMMTPVKELCLEHQIPVYQPKRIRHAEEVQKFKAIQADVAVVIAYGQILPHEILSHPRYGCLNIHASLLPKYRGAAPYQWAILRGEKETGITTMQMDVGMDTGDMLLKSTLNIASDETAGSLHDRLMVLGGDLILETLDGIEAGTLKPIQQQEDEATYAPMLKKEEGNIDWSQSAKEIEQKIRGLCPWPSAYSYFNGDLIKLWKAEVEMSPIGLNVEKKGIGTICHIDKNRGIGVCCGQGILYIQCLQEQGKKRMEIKDYLNGHTLNIGDKFNEK